jgi:hypothetical protein
VAITDQNRAIYDAAGINAVKLELAMGGTRFNLGYQSNAAQAQEWVKETEARMRREQASVNSLDAKRYDLTLWVAIIGAVASIVAAITGVMAILR